MAASHHETKKTRVQPETTPAMHGIRKTKTTRHAAVTTRAKGGRPPRPAPLIFLTLSLQIARAHGNQTSFGTGGVPPAPKLGQLEERTVLEQGPMVGGFGCQSNICNYQRRSRHTGSILTFEDLEIYYLAYLSTARESSKASYERLSYHWTRSFVEVGSRSCFLGVGCVGASIPCRKRKGHGRIEFGINV